MVIFQQGNKQAGNKLLCYCLFVNQCVYSFRFEDRVYIYNFLNHTHEYIQNNDCDFQLNMITYINDMMLQLLLARLSRNPIRIAHVYADIYLYHSFALIVYSSSFITQVCNLNILLVFLFVISETSVQIKIVYICQILDTIMHILKLRLFYCSIMFVQIYLHFICHHSAIYICIVATAKFSIFCSFPP